MNSMVFDSFFIAQNFGYLNCGNLTLFVYGNVIIYSIDKIDTNILSILSPSLSIDSKFKQ